MSTNTLRAGLLCAVALVSAYPVTHLSAAPQQAAPSIEQLEAEFIRLDALRAETDRDSQARAIASADAAKQAAALGWQLQRLRQTSRASEWLRQHVMLQLESDVIWGNILSADATTLMEAVAAAHGNDSRWSELGRLTLPATVELLAAIDPDSEQAQRLKQLLLLTADSNVTSKLHTAWIHLTRQRDYAGRLRVATLAVTWADQWLTIAGNSPVAQLKLADALDDVGATQRELGNPSGAQEHYERALAVRRSVPVETVENRGRRVFSTLIKRAELELDAGQLERSRQLLREALADIQSLPSSVEPSELLWPAEASIGIYQSLGFILETEGRYAEALVQYREAEQQARQFVNLFDEWAKTVPNGGSMVGTLASLVPQTRINEYLLRGKLGEVEIAHTEVGKLVDQFAAEGKGDAAAALLTRMASLDLDREQLDSAGKSLQLALDYFTESGNSWAQIATHLRLVTLLERQGRGREAASHAATGLALAQAAQQRFWIGRAAIAALRVQLEAPDAATERELRGLIADHFEALAPEHQAAALVVEGRAEEVRGRADVARTLYSRAADQLEALRVDPLSQERFYEVGGHHEAYEHLISLAVKRGDAEDAFQQLFRSRRKTCRAPTIPRLSPPAVPSCRPCSSN